MYIAFRKETKKWDSMVVSRNVETGRKQNEINCMYRKIGAMFGQCVYATHALFCFSETRK